MNMLYRVSPGRPRRELPAGASPMPRRRLRARLLSSTAADSSMLRYAAHAVDSGANIASHYRVN